MFGYDIKTLYHGSNVEVKRGDFSKSREDIDFGIGFYLTEDERMAKKWACSRAKSILNCYTINLANLSTYQFGLDEEWLLYIKANRIREDGCEDILSKYSEYDVLIGPTADDKLFDTVQLYIDGYISAEQTVQFLNVAGHSNQIVLKTEKALDECHFLNSKEIFGGEKAEFIKWTRQDRINANKKLDELMEKSGVKRRGVGL